VKLTMGTGTFLNVNTGRMPRASVAGEVDWCTSGICTHTAQSVPYHFASYSSSE